LTFLQFYLYQSITQITSMKSILQGLGRQKKAIKVAIFTGRKYTFLDAIVPFIWHLIRQEEDYRIFIYYCSKNRKETLLNDIFYKAFFHEEGIIHRTIFDANWSMRKFFGLFVSLVCKILARFHRIKFVKLLYGIVSAIESKLTFDLNTCLNKVLFSSEEEGVIIVDERLMRSGCPWREIFLKFAQITQRHLFIRNHGLHQWSFGIATFKPLEGVLYEYWCPCPAQLLPDSHLITKEVYSVGSPGFDTDWIKFIKSKNTRKKDRSICVYLIRKILPPTQRSALDWGDITFAEFFNNTKVLFKDSGLHEEMDIIIKPYPTMDEGILHMALQELDLRSYEIEYSTIYSLVGNIDLVVGELSGSFFIPYFARIPSVMMGFGIERLARESVKPELRLAIDAKAMRPGWYYYMDSPEQLVSIVDELWDETGSVSSIAKSKMEEGIAYMRKLFPDNSADRCFKRMLLARKS